MGVARLRRAGVPFLIVSTERNPVVAARGAKLGVEVISGVQDKATVVLDWLTARGIDPTRTVYVGNDVNDLPALEVVGWPVAVADANPEVLRAARLVLSRPGGGGAVREICELVLEGRRAETVSRPESAVASEPPQPGSESAGPRPAPVPAGSV
jgi:N-acylneuraminate cytidylyltransferase